MHNALTDISGITVGHWTNPDAATGCTAILCPSGAVAGVDVRGGAPGSRELALLNPTCSVEQVHAIMLSGGSAYGLAAADGAMRWLEERGHGFNVGVAKVPLVPSAIIFDLAIGKANVRPDAEAGYAACEAASDGPVAEGNVGVGTGATVGKLLGPTQASKGGLGTCSKRIGNGIVVAALVVVNALGDVRDPQSNTIIAGARRPVVGGFADSMKFAESRLGQTINDFAQRGQQPMQQQQHQNTTLAVIATNVALTKAGATKVAQMAHDGLARVIRPLHTAFDGDTVFALSLGDKRGDPSLVGAVAADVLSDAVLRGIRAAETLHSIPGIRQS